ncbi:MAG: HD-GYP domain-containing protein [Treponema sp.]|nr:HD-GYP domain-containing protein [Treponema sp.]
MGFLQLHQTDLMLILSGICAILVLFILVTKGLSTRRKSALIIMESSASLLLFFDRYAYIYRGDPSEIAWWMVRISNFCVYFFSLSVLFSFNIYLHDLYCNEFGGKRTSKRLIASHTLYLIGVILVIVSQFTGMYYTFDELNYYHRSYAFMLCYLIPFIVIMLQFSFVIQYNSKLSNSLRIPLILFSTMPVGATLAQIFMYGYSLTNITLVIDVVMLYIFTIIYRNRTLEMADKRELILLRNEQKTMRIIFEQTAEALANAIDAKDKYTHGHSTRVAEYSRKIAILSGLNERECDEVYFAALLHDVGKIGVPDNIINKEGRLTDDEFSEIKKHPVIGRQILSSINRSPYLSIGANFHHERFDGRGYPSGLKGNDIPSIARIIAVADAYDAMTSRRSYRDPLPQVKVREEIVKGMETQFDPSYARVMLSLIDNDTSYVMKETSEVKELAGKNSLTCREYRSVASEGILIQDHIVKIRLFSNPLGKDNSENSIPSFVLFDSLDCRIHDSEKRQKEMNYFEYGELSFDGDYNFPAMRNVVLNVLEEDSKKGTDVSSGICYEIEAVRVSDHLSIRIDNGLRILNFICALPDSTRYVYLALTGENCFLSGVQISKEENPVKGDFIPRIAEKISFIDAPAGDIPNVQIDGWMASYTEGVPLENSLELTFHSKSLPTANLIWHCPFVCIYSSEDGNVDGKDYQRFVLLRFDGENWNSDSSAENTIYVNKSYGFTTWDAWKELNKNGMDCTVSIVRKGNVITVFTENGGISIRCKTVIKSEVSKVYVALTGDQVALTGIKISST